MAWPPTTHAEVEDAVTSLRGMAQFPTGVYVTVPGNPTGSLSPAVGQPQATPIFLPSGTVSELAVRVVTASTGGGTVQLGLYSTSGTLDTNLGRIPGTLLATGTAMSTDTTGVKSLVISQAVTGGLYWLGAINLVAAATFASVGQDSQTGRVGVGSGGLSSSYAVILRSSGPTSLPSPFVPTSSSSAGMRMWCVMSAID